MAKKIVFWNRLEPRPQLKSLERPLRAEVRDALWMLSRQWQMGEFIGEDTGTPAFVNLTFHTTPISRLSLNRNKARAFRSGRPLEAEVEQEYIPLSLQQRMEMGRHWLRMLSKLLPEVRREAVANAFRENKMLHFRVPANYSRQEKFVNGESLSNENYTNHLQAVANGRMIDGGRLFETLKTEKASVFLDAYDAAVDSIGDQFLDWAARLYGQSVESGAGWNASQLEYRFDCALSEDGEAVQVLRVNEYRGKKMDWHTFRTGTPAYEGGAKGLTEELEEGGQTRQSTVIPGRVAFPGMPAARWWEMEDGEVNFGNLDLDVTETGMMLLGQYLMMFGNDWLVAPLTIPAGQLCRVEKALITDVFGQQVYLQHYRETPSGKAETDWGLFEVAGDTVLETQGNQWLLIPPVSGFVQESAPVEQVGFVRDELANMAWGIESVVPDGVRKGENGFERALRVREYFRQLSDGKQESPPLPNEAKLRWQIGTTVPENRIPLLPVQLPESRPAQRRLLLLQRAAMPRIVPGFPYRRIRPQTHILRKGLDGPLKEPYYIFEEEAPRTGVVVQSCWRRTRWQDGSIAIWAARQKTIGRGEANGQLKFDLLVENNKEEV